MRHGPLLVTFGDVEDEMHSLSLLIALELTAPWIEDPLAVCWTRLEPMLPG